MQWIKFLTLWTEFECYWEFFFFLHSITSSKYFEEQILCSAAPYQFSCIWTELSATLSTTIGKTVIIMQVVLWGANTSRKSSHDARDWSHKLFLAQGWKYAKQQKLPQQKAPGLQKHRANQEKWYPAIFRHREELCCMAVWVTGLTCKWRVLHS